MFSVAMVTVGIDRGWLNLSSSVMWFWGGSPTQALKFEKIIKRKQELKGAVSDNFLAKKGHWVTDSKRGVTACEIAQNPDNFNFLRGKKKNFPAIYKQKFTIWWFCRNILIEKAKIAWHWVKSCEKGGHLVTNWCRKGVYWQAHSIHRPIWRCPWGSEYVRFLRFHDFQTSLISVCPFCINMQCV